MLSIALKHIVFEKCVDVFFSKIADNFLQPRLPKVSIEKAFDLNVFTGCDINSHLMDALKFEIQNEVDNEIIKIIDQYRNTSNIGRQCGKTSTITDMIMQCYIDNKVASAYVNALSNQ